MNDHRVVSTLSRESFDGLAREVQALGLTLVQQPLLLFETDEFRAALAAAVRDLAEYRAVAITSPRSARLFASAVGAAQVVSPPVWTTGRGTARALENIGPVVVVDAPALDGAAAALARIMIARGASGPVLFPCGEQHRDELPGRLRDAGVEVAELVCYRAVIAPPAELRSAAQSGDVIIVGSGRVAQALADATRLSERPSLVAVGPVTAAAAAAAGWSPAATADEPTTPSLVSAVRSVLTAVHGARQ